MSTNFIPSFHFDHPESKLTSEWCKKVVDYYLNNTSNKNLLSDKKVDEINQYSSGNIDMKPFKKMMFASIRKADKQSGMSQGNTSAMFDLSASKTGLSFEPLCLIPQKLNSAIATIQKVPIEVQCVAQDGLAMKKKKDDIEFLKAKPLIEADLQEIADNLQLGKVDIGGTKNSSKKFSESPMGLDLNDPDEENIFAQLLYSLNVESANEKALQQMYALKKAHQVKLLEIIDQFKFGISVHSAFNSSITGLPDICYEYPGDIETPKSLLPDFSDNTHRVQNKLITVMEMFNYFSNEIESEEKLEEIVNGDRGYCACNSKSPVAKGNWNTFKIGLKLVEVKSVDWVGVSVKKGSKRGGRSLSSDSSNSSHKIWAQNTYRFWWVVNTDYCFGIERLPYSHRERGMESYQNFSTNIYKSQPKSAVELSIGENKKAQIADIKLEHAIIKSLPPGKYIDLKFLRNALDGLKDENNLYTQQDLINMAFEHNIMIGDTDGFDGANDGQLKPFMEIPGGLKAELAGYISTILNADRNIGNITGINEQLTGQSANPEGLVGLQKLLINGSINAIYYCTEAIQNQYQALFNIWASLIQSSIEKGGASRKAIVDFIGIEDTDILDGLDETPVHNLTIKILVGQREVEKQNYINRVEKLIERGVISTADEYMLSGIDNPKERFAYLAVKEKRFLKKQDQIRAESFANQQQLIAKQGENEMQKVQAEGEKDIKIVYAKGDVESKILQLANTLGLSKEQSSGLVKMALQKDRNIAQKDKALSLAREKHNLNKQEQFI